MRVFGCKWLFSVFLLCWTCAYGQNHLVAVGDLNGDGKPDVVVANPSLNNIGVFLNTGGALGPGAFLAVSNKTDSLTLADANGDGHLDIILVGTDSSAGTHLQVMLGDGAGNFAAPEDIAAGASGPIVDIVVADFNGDNFPDIAFAFGASSPQVGILFGDGHGGFSAPRVITAGNDTTSAAELLLLDFNKDSKPDLVVNTARVTGGFAHESFLLLNDGTANFSVSSLGSAGFTSDTAGWVATAADFNSDGFLDLLFGTGSSPLVIFGDGHGGTLSALSPILTLGAPQGFAADVDGNQRIDLVSPTGNYFPGNGHGGFGDAILLAFPPSSSLIAVFDMNGDGKPDFIVQSGTTVSVILNSLISPTAISASTELLLTPSANTTSVGLPVTLTASVSSYGGTPAGIVTFLDGTQSLGSAPVDLYGAAALSTSLAAGLHNNLTASFAGTLDASTNTVFLNSNALSAASVSVNSSQPTAAAPMVSLTAVPNPARVNNPVTITATVTSSSGTPTGNIVLQADGNVLRSFPIGQTVVVFPTVGLHNLQATYGGDAAFPQASSATLVEDVRLTVAADFSMQTSPQSATVRAGQSASFNITINPIGAVTSTIGFSCTGLPAGASCSFSPATLTPGINPVSTTLTLTTTAGSTAASLNMRQPGPLFGLLAFAAFFMVLIVHGRRNGAKQTALAGIAILLALWIAGCGGSGSGSNGTPAGTSSVTVTATSAISHTAVLNITP